jgi:hypothetical protein
VTNVRRAIDAMRAAPDMVNRCLRVAAERSMRFEEIARRSG